MAFIKITYIFNAQRQGWSESWYIQKDSLFDTVNAANVVAEARKRLLGTGTLLEAIRLSDDQKFRDSLLSQDIQFSPIQKDPLLVRDLPSSAWLARVEAGTLYRRSQWLRGIPDKWISYDPVTLGAIKDPVLVGQFQVFSEKVVGQSLRIKALDKGPDHPEKPITNMRFDADTGFIEVTAPNNGFLTLDDVHIRLAKGTRAEQANGIWTIFDVTPNTFNIRPPAGETFTGPIVYAGKGVVRKRFYVYPLITGLELLRPAKKDTGRAFFVPAGRRRRRKS